MFGKCLVQAFFKFTFIILVRKLNKRKLQNWQKCLDFVENKNCKRMIKICMFYLICSLFHKISHAKSKKYSKGAKNHNFSLHIIQNFLF